MKVTIEKPSKSKDFGELSTVCIRAYSPEECFKLGNMAKELQYGGNPAVWEIPHGKEGMLLRIPLATAAPLAKQVHKMLNIDEDDHMSLKQNEDGDYELFAKQVARRETNEKSGLQIGDRIRVLSGSTYCDPIHYGRVGEVIEIEPGGEYEAIGVRLRPVSSMVGGEENSQPKNYIFDRQALVLFDWQDEL